MRSRIKHRTRHASDIPMLKANVDLVPVQRCLYDSRSCDRRGNDLGVGSSKRDSISATRGTTNDQLEGATLGAHW